MSVEPLTPKEVREIALAEARECPHCHGLLSPLFSLFSTGVPLAEKRLVARWVCLGSFWLERDGPLRCPLCGERVHFAGDSSPLSVVGVGAFEEIESKSRDEWQDGEPLSPSEAVHANLVREILAELRARR